MKPTKIKNFTHLIAAHPVQQAILDIAAGQGIGELSLRAIAKKVGLPVLAPQQIKHHLGQMLRYGFLDIIDGKYQISKKLRQCK